MQTEADKIVKSCHSFFFSEVAQHAYLRQCNVCKLGRLERVKEENDCIKHHEWLLSFLVNKIRRIGLVKWMWSLSSECFFAFEEKKRKTPALTDHSNVFQQFLVTEIKTLKCTTNLST